MPFATQPALHPLLAALRTLDHALFHLINQVLIHPWLDPVMIVITQLGLGGVQIALLALLWARGGPVGRRTVLLCLLAFAISGLIAQVLKPVVARDRPLRAVEECRFLCEMLWARSFPSGHATTSFALAITAGTRHRAWAAPLLLLAALIGYSRIYIGVHFPSDVLGGALLGAATAALVLRLGRRRVKPLEPLP